jgi:hypothetical protein
MRIMLVLLIIVAGIVGLGFYRGWFQVSSDRASDKSNVTLTVDKEKARQDASDAKQKVRGGADNAAETAEKKQVP